MDALVLMLGLGLALAAGARATPTLGFLSKALETAHNVARGAVGAAGDVAGDVLGVGRPAEMCSQRLGCFSMKSPWWSPLRPIPAPDTPEKVGTGFFLFTREETAAATPISMDAVTSSFDLTQTYFDAERTTFFITHGAASSSAAPWVAHLKDALLDRVDANVIVTDWAPGASGLLKFGWVVANARVVGKEMARLIINAINKYDLDPQKVHLIGHGLGAHISSYCAKDVDKIRKLTALDPTQPFFEHRNKLVRLDASDADFVEVIHTDAKPIFPTLGFGMMGAHGDVDYYINGGFTQPGCLIPKDVHPFRSLRDLLHLKAQVVENFIFCPHMRATEVYIEAVRSTNCTFWGHPKNIVQNIFGAVSLGYLHRHMTPSDKDCTGKSCSPLGLDNEHFPARGKFVVPTTSREPYCIHEPLVDELMGKHKKNDGNSALDYDSNNNDLPREFLRSFDYDNQYN